MDFRKTKSIFRILSILLVCLLYTMCLPLPKEYWQTLYIKNGSVNDTLDIELTPDICVRHTLCPGDNIPIWHYEYAQKIDEDNLKAMVNNYTSLKVFRHDTCVAHWQGSMSNMGDSIHDFFNHDAWQGKIHGDDYLYYFTITEDDLRQPVE